MTTNRFRLLRTRWAAIGAAVAITFGAGGIGITQATTTSGTRAIYRAISPCRLADTRAEFQVGPRSAALGPNETYTVSGWGSVGNCSLPSGTAALALNVTATDATAPTFLQVFPADATRPSEGSNLNPVPGQPPTPNAVNATLSSSGQFNVFNLGGNVNVIIDVVGIFDDHNHDDRYPLKQSVYTKGEIDAKLAPANSIELTALDFRSQRNGLALDEEVEIDYIVRYDGIRGDEQQCALAILDAPAGGVATRFSMIYLAVAGGQPYDVKVEISVANVSNAPGSYPGSTIIEPSATVGPVALPATANGATLANFTVAIPNVPLGPDGDIPILSVCISGQQSGQRVSMLSATLEL